TADPQAVLNVSSITKTTPVTVIAATVAPGFAGLGYKLGDKLTVVGGDFTTAAVLTVSGIGAGGAVTTGTGTTAGSYFVLPTNPVSITGGSGNGLAKFNLTYAGAITATGVTKILSGGTGYKVNDILIVQGGNFATPARLRVTAIGPGGSVTAATV